MKGGSRAAILSLLLFLLWGTVLTAPSRYFAEAFMNGAVKVSDTLKLPTVLSGFLTVIFLGTVSVVLLILSAHPISRHIGGLCAVIGLMYYVYHAVKTKTLEPDMIFITVGLACAFLFLLFRTEMPNRWLADVYIFSIPVLLFRELLLTPVFRVFGWSPDLLSPIIRLDTASIADRIGDFLSVPLPVWSAFLLALILAAVAFFAHGRE